MTAYNPIAVTVYFLSVIVITMFSTDAVLLSLSLFGSLALYLFLNGRKNPKSHLFSLFLYFGIVFLNPFVSHNGVTVLFVINHSPITLEAVIYGAIMGGMVISVLYWCRIFTQIMTSDKLLYVFGAFSPKVALMLSMAIRYIPLFGRQAEKINNSQKALGIYKDESITDNIRSKTRIFSVMVTWALENGIVTADSMAARGYGIGKRSRFSIFKFTTKDIFLVCASIVLVIITLWGMKYTEFVCYPAISFEIKDVFGIIGYISYGILTLLPVIIEVKEALRWKYLKSKI